MSPAAQVCWCCFYAAGLIGMLALYGVLQERIMTMPYGGVVFGYSVFLVFCNRLAAVIFAAVMLRLSGEPVLPQAPLWKYLIISLSNVYASTCQYEALKHVSFVVQMLGKSFKMMPVMLWGMAVSGKSYSLRDWLMAVAVTVGMAEFLVTGPTASSASSGDAQSTWLGYPLLISSLLLDGATSVLEERVFREHGPSKFNQILYVNGLSALVAFFTLLVTGDAVPALAFCASHPSLFKDVGWLSITSAGSQFFIFSLVKEYGALAFAATTNVRQVASILVSNVKFHHFISSWQVVGLTVVFGALLGNAAKRFQEAVLTTAGEKQPLMPAKAAQDPESLGEREPPEAS
uniref:Sugar phosphate transporter domain-containing protein n=1 Tax=Alexandrium monilatum TaxID=311494 RepID=A0A7S4SPT2_9DINO